MIAVTPMHPAVAEAQRWISRPFVWGECDCLTVLADWVLRMRGIDPMAGLRLTYGTAGECQRVTGFFTDPMGVMGRVAEAAGLQRRLGLPQMGDIGLLLSITGPGRTTPHGGLFLGTSWACKAEAGLTTLETPGKVLAVWGVLD